eukprot:5617719-Karenia_brevis.AAC.1
MLCSERPDANASKSKSKPSSRQIRAAGKQKQRLAIIALKAQVSKLQEQVVFMRQVIIQQQHDIEELETASPASPEPFELFDDSEGLQFSKPTDSHATPLLFDLFDADDQLQCSHLSKALASPVLFDASVQCGRGIDFASP